MGGEAHGPTNSPARISPASRGGLSMSRYIATRAIRGANAIVREADQMLQRAIAEKGAETPVAFPNTAYHLPLILGMTGGEVDKISDLTPVMEQAKGLLHPVS